MTSTPQTKLPLPTDELVGPQQVCLEKLFELYPHTDPYSTEIWNDFVLDNASILSKIKQGKLDPVPFNCRTKAAYTFGKDEHEMRVAYLVVHGWDDAIEIDVGVPGFDSYGDIPVRDGNHRIAAAVLRGDTYILASCSGEEGRIRELL